jgi:uncharacterized membrane-anchored protein YhcB (DUF1043 family)
MMTRTMFRMGLAAGVVLGITALGHSQEGVKQTEKLLNKAEDTMKSITDARGQIQKTLDTYNTLVQGKAQDPKKAYKDLQKEMDRCDDRVADTRKRMDAMQGEADKYFTDWSSSLSGIGNTDLKKKSADRLNQTRAQYDGILKSAQSAGDAFKPFMGSLRDQIVFLGHDLNPSALKSLAGTASKLNTDAGGLFGKIDGAVGQAGSYITALRPSN